MAFKKLKTLNLSVLNIQLFGTEHRDNEEGKNKCGWWFANWNSKGCNN